MKLLLMKGQSMLLAKTIVKLLLEGIKARAEFLMLPASSGTQDTPTAPTRDADPESSRPGGKGGSPK